MKFKPVLAAVAAALFALSWVPAQAAPPKLSSETSAAQLCLDFELGLEDLMAWCTSARTEPGVATRDLERILNNIGWLASRLEGPEAALAAYEESLALNPMSAAALSGMGWASWDLRDHAAAADYFRRAGEISTSAPRLAGLASSLWHLDADVAEVISLLEQALLVDPEYIWAARELAWVYADLGDAAKADEYFDLALSVDGEDAWAMYGKSDLRIDEGNLEAALNLVNRAIAIEEAPEFLTYRAYIMNENANYRQAIEDAARALAIAPHDGDAARQKARAHEEMGHLNLAREAFASADDEGASGAYFFSEYAHVLYQLDELEEALVKVEASLAIHGDDWAHSIHSVILQELGRFEESITAANQAVALDETYAYPHVTIAYSKIALGQMDEALGSAQKAQELGASEGQINDLIRQLVSDGRILDAIRFRAALHRE